MMSLRDARIYVGSLPGTIEDEHVRALCAPHGLVETVQVIRSRHTGRSLGFAFVHMATAQDARKTIEALNGSNLQGETLRCYPA